MTYSIFIKFNFIEHNIRRRNSIWRPHIMEGNKIFALIGPKDELDRDVFLQYMNTEPGIPEIVYQDDEGYIVVEYK